MDAAEVGRALRRIADEIAECHGSVGLGKLAIVGIHTRGVEVARRLCDLLEATAGVRPAFGVLDVSMHRDDLRRRARVPSIQPTRLPVDMDERTLILVDDVFFTGRTIRAALDALFDHGRPGRVQLLVLIDRGHRELPIEASFVGRHVQTTAREIVEVKLHEIDGDEQVILVERTD